MNTTNMLGFALKNPLIQGIKSHSSTTIGDLKMWAHGGSGILPQEPAMQAGLCVLTIPVIMLISAKVYQYITDRSEMTNIPAAEQVTVSASSDNDKPKTRGTRRGGRRGGRGRYKAKQQTPSPSRRPAFETLPVQAKVWNNFAVTAPKQYLEDANKAYEASRAPKNDAIKVREPTDTIKENYKCTKKAPTCETPAPPSPERKTAIPPHLRTRAGRSNITSET